MRYSISVTLAVFCSLSTAAQAQQATAPVLADVNQALIITSTGQTDFGSIDNFAHTETIDPRAPTAGQQTAVFTLSIGSGSVHFSCSEVTLTEPVSSATMTFTPQLPLSVIDDQSTGSTPFSCTGGAVSTVPHQFLWRGGGLAVASNQAPGSYSGVFTLTAAYQ